MKNIKDWTAEMNGGQKFSLPEPMKSRYAGYPESWVRFVSIIESKDRFYYQNSIVKILL